MSTLTALRSRSAHGIAAWACMVFVLALMMLAAPSPARAGVNDFEFDSFHAEYWLDTDEDGHSTLRTRETLVALFPEHDQNRGIERAIPNHYRDFPTEIEVVSVTDETGRERPFTTRTDGDFDIVTIAVPEGEFVHGAQSYVIEYLQRDVTAYFSDVGRDEFYWDVNGTGWAQPFHRVSATLHVASELATHLTGDVSCYRGSEGSTNRCQVEQTEEPERGTRFTIATDSIGSRENVTLAVGFDPEAFTEPEPGFVRKHAVALTALPLVTAALLGVTILVLSRTAWRDARRSRAIVAQYEPSPKIDVALAAELLGRRSRAAVASMLDLAVRGNTRILQYQQLHVRNPAPVFGIQHLSDDGLNKPERAFSAILFPPKTRDGTRWFSHRSQQLAEGMAETRRLTKRRAVELELRRKLTAGSLSPAILAGLLALAAQTLALYTLITQVTRDLSLILPALTGLAGSVASGFLIAYALRRRPLTEKGRQAVDQLHGLREFIRMAETDRLVMLQSVSGAQSTVFRSPGGFGSELPSLREADTERDVELAIVHIYERLLPYAVLFGFEREWMHTLTLYYQYVQPHWLLVDDRSRIPDIASHFTGFVSSMSNSYSGSQHSADSGGSGGGGSSGGGGGGGGGGGV